MAGLEEPRDEPDTSLFGLPRDERARSFVYKSMIQSYVESGKNHDLKLMVVGEAGQGKSTLINALVGQEVAKEGDDFKAGTLKAQRYTLNQNGVVISIWDTPGFGMGKPEEDEAMVRQLKEEGCDNIDLALFCVRVDTMRFPTYLHMTTIQKLNRAFGWKFWRHCLFVLTFANNIQQFCPPDESMNDYFSRRCFDLEEQIKAALKEHAQLDSDVLDTVRAVPVGSHRKGLYRDNQWALPDREDWFIMFWIECTEHMQQSALSALLRTNYHRLESEVTQSIQLQSSRPPPPRFIEGHDRLLQATPKEMAEIRLQMERENKSLPINSTAIPLQPDSSPALPHANGNETRVDINGSCPPPAPDLDDVEKGIPDRDRPIHDREVPIPYEALRKQLEDKKSSFFEFVTTFAEERKKEDAKFGFLKGLFEGLKAYLTRSKAKSD